MNKIKTKMKTTIRNFARIFVESVPSHIEPRPWMKCAYRSYSRRESVMVAWPLNYAVQFAWMLNLAWCKYCHRPSWIDREVERRMKKIKP